MFDKRLYMPFIKMDDGEPGLSEPPPQVRKQPQFRPYSHIRIAVLYEGCCQRLKMHPNGLSCRRSFGRKSFSSIGLLLFWAYCPFKEDRRIMPNSIQGGAWGPAPDGTMGETRSLESA